MADRQGAVTRHSFTFTLCNRGRPFGAWAQGRRGARSPARVRGRRGWLAPFTDSRGTRGSFLYRQSRGAPSVRRAHPLAWHKLIVVRKLCEARSVPPQQEGAPRPASSFDLPIVLPDPTPPAALAGLPEINAHQCAPHSLHLLLRSYDCHLHCQRCPCSSAGCVVTAARLLTRTSWDHPAASREKQMGGRYCLVPSVRPSRLPQPHGPRSHGPLRCRETPRFVPAPPVAPACARGGAACGVARLEQCDRRRA